jgi:hypothetical protein
VSVTATVTIPYPEFEQIQQARREAEQEAAELRRQISSTKVEASDPSLVMISKSMLEIVRFAVSMLPPESTKGWPTKSLREIAALMPMLPYATMDHQELARTLEVFALECERFEMRRRGSTGSINPETLMPISEAAG